MDARTRYTWIVTGCLLVMAMAGLALGTPSHAVAQTQDTPTYSAPPPRTLPPGLRATPTPEPVKPPPGPTSAAPADTPTPLPTPGLVPVSGGSERAEGSNNVFVVLVGAGILLLALSAIGHRRLDER